jgi:hypothetical protein
MQLNKTAERFGVTRASRERGFTAVDTPFNRGGSVCLNRFSGLISGFPAVFMKMMDPRSGTA